MNKLIKAGIIGLGVMAFYKIVSKGEALSSLLFSISKIGFSFANNGLILVIYLNVKNVKNESIELNEIFGDILLNDEIIGSIKNELQISIPENGEKILPVSINLFFGPLSEMVARLINGSVKQTTIFKLQGYAIIEKVKFPLNIKYSLF